MLTGNMVIDAVMATVRDDFVFEDKLLRSIDFNNKRVILVTKHRRFRRIYALCYQALWQIVEENKDVAIVFPVHKNPKVVEVLESEFGDVEGVYLIEPLNFISVA